MKPAGWKRARSLRLGERDSVLIAFFGNCLWITVKKWTRYAFGLGQGRLGMKNDHDRLLC
jgi:hypothetical protein